MNLTSILTLFKNKKTIFRLFKLFRASLRDPLFYLLFADYILTLFVIKSGSGIEANPLVLWLGNDRAFIVELLIYFVIVPKKNWGFVRIILIAWYCFIISRHLIFLWG